MRVTELRFIHKLFREERCSSLYTFEESNTNNYDFTTILIQKYSSHFTWKSFILCLYMFIHYSILFFWELCFFTFKIHTLKYMKLSYYLGVFETTLWKQSPKIHLHFDNKVKVTTLPLVHILLNCKSEYFSSHLY